MSNKLLGHLISEEQLAEVHFAELMTLRMAWPGYHEAQARRDRVVSDFLDVAITLALGALGVYGHRHAGRNLLYVDPPDAVTRQLFEQQLKIAFDLARTAIDANSLDDIDKKSAKVALAVFKAKASDLLIHNIIKAKEEGEDFDPDEVDEVGECDWWTTFGETTFEEFRDRYRKESSVTDN
jgi:hypothetical protein